MRFENINNYPEVSLSSGLEIISMCPFLRLYSDGLESDEYFQYTPTKGICYEDGCIIGSDVDSAISRLNECPIPWHKTAKFYLDTRIHFKQQYEYSIDDIQHMMKNMTPPEFHPIIRLEPITNHDIDKCKLNNLIDKLLVASEIGESKIYQSTHCINIRSSDINGVEPGVLYIKQIKRRGNP